MLRLIPFELRKIWRKRSFILSMCALLSIHLFLLWYTSLPQEDSLPLSAYQTLNRELAGKSEDEKAQRIAGWKKTVDGVCFVRDILAMQSFQSEMGESLALQELEKHPGVFEQYYSLYQSGDYLRFTSSLEQEQAFLDEIYDQQQKVAGYGDYLQSIQESQNSLGGISIFSGQTGSGFSARNLRKAANDYAGLNDCNVRFTPAKPVTSAMQSVWTDLLLVLGIMLFVGGLVTEEKEKQLFFVTRCTRYGVLHSMGAKLAALLIHSCLVPVIFYSISLLFFGMKAGWFDWSAALQSVAAYRESSLDITIAGYILISLLTKALALFGVGAVLTLFCILSGLAAMPFLVGAGIVGGSALLYYFIPAGSLLSPVKYLNPVGVMKTENLYGGYLNFNCFGYPLSRLGLSLGLIILLCVAGTAGSLLIFRDMKSFEVRRLRLPSIPFTPHTSLLRHESYKLLITNRALPVLLLFGLLLGYRSLGHSYSLSVGEQYYQSIMGELEGQMTPEKESLVLSERHRYEDALQNLEQIDQMVGAGELDNATAEALKAPANMTLAFYPFFQRVESQYAHIQEDGGCFVYDTGYLWLFGILDDAFSADFLILSIGIVLAVSETVSMEYQTGAVFLISAAKTGLNKILLCKGVICSLIASAMSLVPLVCRFACISATYPMGNWFAAVQSIPRFSEFCLPLPVWSFLLLFAISQMLAMVLVALATIFLSVWRKDQVQTVFWGLLLLAVPTLLKLLGFKAAGLISFYPLYGWTGMG